MSVMEQLEYFEKLQSEDIMRKYKLVHEKLLSAVRFEWSFVGNFEEKAVVEVAKAVSELFFVAGKRKS